MKKALLFAFVLVFMGCATMDSVMSTRGVITDNVSKMDGRRIVRMSPVLPGGEGVPAEFNLYWDSAKKDRAFIGIQVSGGFVFAPNDPMEMKIDGELFKFYPVNSAEYGDVEIKNPGSQYSYVSSTKFFWIYKRQILKIATAKETYYRIRSANNTFADGEIVYIYPTLQSFVPLSFNQFYKAVWGE